MQNSFVNSLIDRILNKFSKKRHEKNLLSFYQLLDSLEFLSYLPQFKLVNDDSDFIISNYNGDRKIAYQTFIKQGYGYTDRNYCVINLKIIPSLLTQKSQLFLEKYFGIVLEKKQNQTDDIKNNYSFRIEIRIEKDENFKIVFYFSLFQDSLYLGSMRIPLIVPFGLTSQIEQKIFEIHKNNKRLNRERFEHIIFIKTISKFLKKDEMSLIIKKGITQNKFITDLIYFLEDFYKHDLFFGIQKIENLQQKDEILLQVQNLRDYNYLVTTQTFRNILELLNNIVQEQVFEIKSLNLNVNGLHFEINLPPFVMNEKIFNFLSRYFGNDFKKWIDTIEKKQIKNSYLEFRVTKIPYDCRVYLPYSDRLFFYTTFKVEGPGEPLITGKGINFILRHSNDFDGILKKILNKKMLGQREMILEFLKNLKKGNIVELMNDSYYLSTVDALEELNLYSQIYYLQNFSQGLQQFFKEIVEQNNIQLKVQEEKKVISSDFFNVLADETFEKALLF